jgi:hypothetical protein
MPTLYHGTTIAKARSIVTDGIKPRGSKNTFGKSISFSDKPIGTRFYDKGAVLVFEFLPHAKLITLAEFQKNGRGDADAVASSPDNDFGDREIAVFNPSSIRCVGWYNKQTKAVDRTQPSYPKGFYHSWYSE